MQGGNFSIATAYLPHAALKHPMIVIDTTIIESPNTHHAACGFVQIGVGHKKALHLPLGERNAFHMQLIRHRVLTQMRTNDRIEIQKGTAG